MDRKEMLKNSGEKSPRKGIRRLKATSGLIRTLSRAFSLSKISRNFSHDSVKSKSKGASCSSSSISSARSSSATVPSDVPAGHVAVYVGADPKTRFVIKATLLNEPRFKGLLDVAKDEYGYDHPGAITFPCSIEVFQEALKLSERRKSVASTAPTVYADADSVSCAAGTILPTSYSMSVLSSRHVVGQGSAW